MAFSVLSGRSRAPVPILLAGVLCALAGGKKCF
jgi:hypothetical protein